MKINKLLNYEKAILISIFLLGTNAVLKIFINSYLSNAFHKDDLIKLFTFIDILNFLLLFIAGFKDTIIVYIGSYGTKYLYEIIKSYFKFSLLLLFFLFPLCYFISYNFSFIEIKYYYWEIFIGLLLNIISFFFLNYLLSQKKYKINTFHDLLKSIIFLLLIKFEFYNKFSLVSIHIITLAFITFILIAKNINLLNFKDVFIKKSSSKINFYSKNLKYSTFEYIFSLIPLYLLSFLITKFFTNHSADFLVVSRPIYMGILYIFIYTFYRFLLPELLKKNYIILNKRIIYYFLFIGIFLPASLFLFAERIILLIFNDSYLGSATLLNILLFTIPMHLINNFLFALYKAKNFFYLTMKIKLLGLLCFFILLLFENSSVITLLYKYSISIFIVSIISIYLFLKLKFYKIY